VLVLWCVYGRREVPWNAVWERAKHASWRGGLQALVVVVGCERRRAEGWRRRYSHCTDDGEVKLYTDDGSGRGGC